ncbi:MAG: GatB/YqeY domain-containing protein [Bacilli bacterium]|nr:GatB/YqeY domain-containing protein [Bacilli bacterium]
MYNKIKEDLLNAMKEQDKFKLSVLRMLKSALQAEEINLKHELTDDEALNIIKKQVKIRTASLEEYKSYNRIDLAENLEKELTILKSYLPEDLSIEELNKIIDEKFDSIKPESIKDMGRVIKEVSSVVGTRADMSLVSKIIKEKLMNM